MTPMKAQTAPREIIPDAAPVVSIDDRLDTISAALEAALDPDATTKRKADALKEVRDGRKSDATVVKR